MRLLTEGAINKVFYGNLDDTLRERIGGLLKAQLKAMVEWGDEDCTEHNHSPIISGFSRRWCYECWQALLKECE